jgi:hypothetical protein
MVAREEKFGPNLSVLASGVRTHDLKMAIHVLT